MRGKLLFIFAILACAAFLAFIATQKSGQGTFALFAYGADLQKETMAARAGGFAGSAAARAYGYHLAFESNRESEFGVANIVEDQNGSVAGAVYWLTEGQIEKLEAFSGPGFYVRKTVIVRLDNGSEVAVVAHVLAGSAHVMPPSKPTVAAIAAGLAEFGYGQEESDNLASAASATGKG